MPRLTLRHALVLSLCMGFPLPASAHEFELLLLAPTGASQADIDDMRTAFLIASAERDSHPNETSEGHLGGMDVQLTLAVTDAAVADAALAFVAAPFAVANDARVAALAAPGNAVIVDAPILARLPADLLDASDGLAAFADRFRAEAARAPGPAAVAAYRSAKAVDLAIRPLGSVEDRDLLRKNLTP